MKRFMLALTCLTLCAQDTTIEKYAVASAPRFYTSPSFITMNHDASERARITGNGEFFVGTTTACTGSPKIVLMEDRIELAIAISSLQVFIAKDLSLSVMEMPLDRVRKIAKKYGVSGAFSFSSGMRAIRQCKVAK